MVKKILLTGVILLITTPIFADDSNNSDETLQIFNPSQYIREEAGPNYVANYLDSENHKKETLNDFYIRISGGVDFVTTDYSLNIDNISNTYSNGGFLGTLTLGYGRKVVNEELYLGLAIDGSLDSSSVSLPSLQNSTAKMPYSFGFYLVPGVYASKNILLYAKVGIAGADYSVSTPSGISSTNINSFDDYILGYRVGAGLEMFLNKNFSFIVEYMFGDYSSAKYDCNYGGKEYNHKFEPYNNQVNLGFAYHLGF